MSKKTFLLFVLLLMPAIFTACENKATTVSQTNEIPTLAAENTPTPSPTPTPPDSSSLTWEELFPTVPLTDDLKEKMVGKWKTSFYAWDRIGREDWDPMVLDGQTVTISMEQVDYLDYSIEDPKFYCRYWSIKGQSTFRSFPVEITRFQEDIIDITISAKDKSLYPKYYAIGFIVIGDAVFIHYQGAYFEISPADETLTPATENTPTPSPTPTPPDSSSLTWEELFPTVPLTDDLKEKIVGKWKTNFYAWHRIGREDWNPMVLDGQTVTISMDEVDYLDYSIEYPIFYCHYNSIEEYSTLRFYPDEITKFEEDIIDISISAKDNSSYPNYYAIGFVVMGDAVFLDYQGAYFEISPADETLTPAAENTPTPSPTPTPPDSSALTWEELFPTVPLTDDLKEKMVGKWKTSFYVWDRIGREDWDPMVLDGQIVTISMEQVDYLDYSIKDPEFYCHYNSIEEYSTLRFHPAEITKFEEDIIDISISAKDDSSYPNYYAIGFIVIGDAVFIHYQGAYFEISPADETLTPATGNTPTPSPTPTPATGSFAL